MPRPASPTQRDVRLAIAAGRLGGYDYAVKKGDVMTKHPPETSNPTGRPDPDDIKVDVINPRYKGATPAMVALALLQRPKKAEQEDDGERG